MRPSRTAAQLTGLRPASASRASHSGTAITNQARPGALKVNTLAAASSRPMPMIERQGGGPSSALVPPRDASASAKASTNRAIAVSLKALCARNEAARYGRPTSAAIAMRRPPGIRSSAASAVSAVSTGIASSRPLKALTSDAPVTCAAITATACGPIG